MRHWVVGATPDRRRRRPGGYRVRLRDAGPGQRHSQSTAHLSLLATHDFNLVGGAYFFWDPLAAVALVEPEVVGFERKSVTVDEDSGATVESADGVEVEAAMSAGKRSERSS